MKASEIETGVTYNNATAWERTVARVDTARDGRVWAWYTGGRHGGPKTEWGLMPLEEFARWAKRRVPEGE